MRVDLELLRKYAPYIVVGLVFSVGLVVALVAILIPNPYSIAVAVSLLGGAPVGFILLRFRAPAEFSMTDFPIFNKILIIAYFLTTVVLISAYVPGQSRSLAVHGSQLILYLICAITIITITRQAVALSLLVSTALIHRLTLYWASSAQIGLDALFHSRLIQTIANLGSLSPLANNKYYYAPVSHLLGAMSEIIFGTNTRIAGMAITTVVVVSAVLGCYVLVSRFFTPTAGLIGAYLLGVSDYLSDWAVQVTPTTVGIALFMTTLLALVITIDDNGIGPTIVLLLVFAAQTLTHQISVFATAIAVFAYLGGQTIYKTSSNIYKKSIRILAVTWTVLMASWLITHRRGPEGDFPPFIAEQVVNFYSQFQVETSGELIRPQMGVSLAGSDSLTFVHITGFTLLFLAAVIGSVHALRLDRRQAAHFTGIGAIVAAVGIMLFPAPAIGVSFFLPNRWYLFFYTAISVLGAIAVAYIIQLLFAQFQTPRKQVIVAAVAIVLLLSPYTALMIFAHPGAIDGPVIDDTPGAFRMTTSPQEDEMYRHTATYATEDGTTVGDHVSNQLVGRYYGHYTASYRVNDSTGEHLHETPLLIIDRSYAKTDSVSYTTVTNTEWRVFGPLPIDRQNTSIVYDAGGGDQLRYMHNESSS